MATALIDRLSQALGAHDVDYDTRTKIQEGWAKAGGIDATWNDLDPETQKLIEQVETLPPTSWDDPSDAPDDLD